MLDSQYINLEKFAIFFPSACEFWISQMKQT